MSRADIFVHPDYFETEEEHFRTPERQERYEIFGARIRDVISSSKDRRLVYCPSSIGGWAYNEFEPVDRFPTRWRTGWLSDHNLTRLSDSARNHGNNVTLHGAYLGRCLAHVVHDLVGEINLTLGICAIRSDDFRARAVKRLAGLLSDGDINSAKEIIGCVATDTELSLFGETTEVFIV